MIQKQAFISRHDLCIKKLDRFSIGNEFAKDGSDRAVTFVHGMDAQGERPPETVAFFYGSGPWR
jgi:hypothetical protein